MMYSLADWWNDLHERARRKVNPEWRAYDQMGFRERKAYRISRGAPPRKYL